MTKWYVNDIIPDSPIAFVYDKSKLKIVHNVDTGERMIVYDYKPKGHKEKKATAAKADRQKSHQ